MENNKLVFSRINTFGKTDNITKTTTLKNKTSYSYPYDNTFGNPFVTTPIYNTKLINNTTVYISYKNNSYYITTNCKYESLFLLDVLNSQIYKNIIKSNISIQHLKFPVYSNMYNYSDIEKFLSLYFHLY